MKQITNSESYNVFLEKLPTNTSEGNMMYRFWSRLESAQNPEDMHKQFELVLSKEELNTLVAELNG